MKQTATVELAGGKTLTIETGHLAKQAQGSAIVRQGDNVVLGTACASPDPREGIDFFPLTVDYREYTYAGGRIPGGFIKREGRPQEREILTARQIDRPSARCFLKASAMRPRSSPWCFPPIPKTILTCWPSTLLPRRLRFLISRSTAPWARFALAWSMTRWS
jgi:hypothetical protein